MSTIRRLCEAHGKRKDRCKECGGSAFCEHGKQKQRCKECKGVSICEHGKQRAQCKQCDPSFCVKKCEHGRVMRYCRECATKMGDKFPYPLEELPVRNIDRKPKEEEPAQKKARKAVRTGAEVTASSLAQLIYEGEVSEEVAQGNDNILLLP